MCVCARARVMMVSVSRDGLCLARARAYEHTRKQIISDAQSRPDLFLEIVIPFQEIFFGINNVLYRSVSRARAWVLSLAVHMHTHRTVSRIYND